jgi:hypothetical protein
MLQLRLQLKIEELCDEEAFPHSYKLLKELEDFFETINYNEYYRSLLDAIFANLYLEVRPLIQLYYQGNGRKASEIFSKKQLKTLDAIFLQALRVLYYMKAQNLSPLKIMDPTNFSKEKK